MVDALGLPPRTCAMELDLDSLPARSSRRPGAGDLAVPAGRCSTWRWWSTCPCPAAELAEALLDGGGELLEDVRLFDVYAGEQVGAGKRSLAYTLRFRAPDRTLTSEEANAARDAAVAVAVKRHAVALRA